MVAIFQEENRLWLCDISEQFHDYRPPERYEWSLFRDKYQIIVRFGHVDVEVLFPKDHHIKFCFSFTAHHYTHKILIF